jgi:hypothetical protein
MPQIKVNGRWFNFRPFDLPLKDTNVPQTSYAQNVIFGTSLLDDGILYADQHQLDILQKELIRRWRQMSMNHYIAFSIDDICSEMIAMDDIESMSIDLDLADTNFSKKIADKIHDEFENITKFLKFKKRGYYMIRQWLIDGISHFYIDKDEKKKEIKSITMLDPLRVAEYNYAENPHDPSEEPVKHFQYMDLVNNNQASFGAIDLVADNLVTVNSGIMDRYNKVWVSILEQAFIPLNQLTALENSLIIYRLARAPERRIFYVDIGELPKSKAEAYMKELIANYRNSVGATTYDAETGEIKETGKKLSMTDDIWLPRSNSKGTEVQTLPGLNNLGEIEDVNYFKNKLFRALNVPMNRFTETQVPFVNRSPEITREEVKYAKFISRMRTQYNELFYILLRNILVLKNIVDADELDEEYVNMRFIWSSDNLFNEFKKLDVLGEKLNVMDRVNEYIGKMFSMKWVMTNIMEFTDDEIKEMQEEIKTEAEMMNSFREQSAEGPPFGDTEYVELPGNK